MKYPTKVEQDFKARESEYAAARERGLVCSFVSVNLGRKRQEKLEVPSTGGAK
jgi:hypothetical protein